MKVDILTLDAKKAGQADLNEAIFGLPARVDILHRVVTWQLAKRRAGTHAVKFRADIARTGKKLLKQKGSGGARHGSRRSNIFRGGGNAFGPIPRDHGHSLNKKVRALGLKTALSVKAAEGKLKIVDVASLDEAKTKTLLEKLGKLGLTNALFIDGTEVNANFKMAVQNVPYIDVLPGQGANVYDILRHDVLVITTAGLAKIEERLK